MGNGVCHGPRVLLQNCCYCPYIYMGTLASLTLCVIHCKKDPHHYNCPIPSRAARLRSYAPHQSDIFLLLRSSAPHQIDFFPLLRCSAPHQSDIFPLLHSSVTYQSDFFPLAFTWYQTGTVLHGGGCVSCSTFAPADNLFVLLFSCFSATTERVLRKGGRVAAHFPYYIYVSLKVLLLFCHNRYNPV